MELAVRKWFEKYRERARGPGGVGFKTCQTGESLKDREAKNIPKLMESAHKFRTANNIDALPSIR